jgi:hypothetical protein
MKCVFHLRLGLAVKTSFIQVWQRKGREPNAPSREAPRSAQQRNTPSRARWGAHSVGSLCENSRFSRETAAEATTNSVLLI